MKIAITTSSFAKYSKEPLDLLEQARIEYVLNPFGRKLTEPETIDLLQGCDGVAAGTEALTASVMDALPKLKVISRCGSGMDNVDLGAAQKKGIHVRNTPEGPTLAVAELIIGLCMNLLRKITVMDRELRSGVWKKKMGHNLYKKKIGIVGFGKIGQRVAQVFEPFGVEIAISDPVTVSDKYPAMNMKNLLEWADIITLHCSVSEDKKPLIREEDLQLMKPGSFVINAARGGVVDEKALFNVLMSGHIAGAAIDVFDKEPYDGPLNQLDNVILTPHIGSYAMQSRIQMETDTITNLIEALNGKSK